METEKQTILNRVDCAAMSAIRKLLQDDENVWSFEAESLIAKNNQVVVQWFVEYMDRTQWNPQLIYDLPIEDYADLEEQMYGELLYEQGRGKYL